MCEIDLVEKKEERVELAHRAGMKGLPMRVFLTRAAGARLGDVYCIVKGVDAVWSDKVEWAFIPKGDGFTGQWCVVIPELVVVDANGEESYRQRRQIILLTDDETKAVWSWFEEV